MNNKTTELDIILQLFNSLSNDDKKSFIKEIRNKEASNKIPFKKEIQCCPHCKSTKFVKNGKSNNTQRFLCRDCNKTFTTTNNTIFFSVKKDIKTWKLYIHCMIEKYSLRKTAKICDISLPTAFAWRHKILDALQTMMIEAELNGVIEADEIFIPLYFKGNHKNFNLPRLAKKREAPATKRGLSKEQVYVSCSVNLNGLSIAKILNLRKPKLKDLEKVLNGKIIKDSVFTADSFRVYLKLTKNMELSYIRIPRNCYKVGIFNIQTINNYHSRLKAMITYNLKGVSTKYLNNYLVYHNFVKFAKDNKYDKETILFDFIQDGNCIGKCIDIADGPTMPLPDVV